MQKSFWRKIPWLNFAAVAAVFVAASLVTLKNLKSDTSDQLLNVSYDPTRELYLALNAQFLAQYEKETGQHF